MKEIKIDFKGKGKVNFQKIKDAAEPYILEICERVLQGGSCEGDEYVAINPRRADQREGSFKINTYTGMWSDFACGDKGGDVISYVAYVLNIKQVEAAKIVAKIVGVNHV